MLSIFFANIKIAIFYFNGSKRLRRKKFVQRGWSCSFPTPTVVSNSKSNMVGQINNHELITLAQPIMMPVLQVDTMYNYIIK